MANAKHHVRTIQMNERIEKELTNENRKKKHTEQTEQEKHFKKNGN